MELTLQFTEPLDYFKRFVDRLPAGNLLIVNDWQEVHARYAKERGWQVTLAQPQAGQQSEFTHTPLRAEGPVCNGPKLFDAVFVLPLPLQPQERERFYTATVNCLQPEGGNLFAILLKQDNDVAPTLGFTNKEVLPLFASTTVDVVQEATFTLASRKVAGWEVSAVKTTPKDDSDSVSFQV